MTARIVLSRIQVPHHPLSTWSPNCLWNLRGFSTTVIRKTLKFKISDFKSRGHLCTVGTKFIWTDSSKLNIEAKPKMENDRKYDFVVYGASGFTGQYTVDEVAKVVVEETLTWAVAGRNMAKLQKVLSESSGRIGRDIEETPIIIADSGSYQSLLEMAQQCKVVLNCVGPYRFYGEEVVKACIEGGASHLDISGEPQFLEKMQLLYNAKAKEKEVFIVGSIGFDSIPAEMGVSYTRKQFKGEVTNIESFVSFHHGPKGSVANTGTYESAVYAIANANELKSLKKSLFPDPMPKFEYRLPKRSVVHYSKEVNQWCLPFLGPDKSVVFRTMRDLLATKRLEKPFEFTPYFTQPTIFHVFGVMLFGIILGIFSRFSLGRSLLLKYPQIFSLGVFKKGGPTLEQIEGSSMSMTFIAHGYKEDLNDRKDKTPDKVITTKLVAPNAGYVTTPICMVQCGVTLLKEKDRLFHKGGVFPPGAVFQDTSLLDRLQNHNVKFSTVN